jgi:hypothetical protein
MVSCSAADPVDGVNITAKKLTIAKMLPKVSDWFVGDMLPPFSVFCSVDSV